MLWLLVFAQGLALAALLVRLAPGRNRRPPVAPGDDSHAHFDGTVTVIVPALNEVHRIGPCLEGLARQGAPVREILVVDSQSVDGTVRLVQEAATRNRKLRLVHDRPLPPGWIGKVWAMETGRLEAQGDWILGVDADVIPFDGMVSGALEAAESGGFDLLSFSPKFTHQSPAERLVQPAMLVTLVYRTGAAGADQPADRVLANGQCFLVRKSLLDEHDGYGVARSSFSDDVTLARSLASAGARVGFMDGSRLFSVCGYASLRAMWREWGRSFDLKDSTDRLRGWSDVLMIWLVQALPVPVLIIISIALLNRNPLTDRSLSYAVIALLILNVVSVAVRMMMIFALRHSYTKRGVAYWLSWLADIPASIRLTMSMAKRPSVWRNRHYA